MYIIKNFEEYVSRTKERIDVAISQNNYKEAFIVFVTCIPYLKEPYLSDFVNYYQEIIYRKCIPVPICNESSPDANPFSYIIRSKM